jgi:lipid-A-disaccharide synthase
MKMTVRYTHKKKLNIIIIAGEASSDLYGAYLAKELFNAYPDIRIVGMGARYMADAGVEVLFDASKLNAVGMVEVITRIPAGIKQLTEVLSFIDNQKPDAVVLIDSPEFNIRLGKRIAGMNIPVIYYVPPTVWAWRRKRAKTIARYFNKIICIFPFEEEIFRQANADVTFLGHPLLDIVKPSMEKNSIYNAYGINPAKTVIGLLPGSRIHEIKRLLPLMVKSIRILLYKFPDIQPVIALAHTVDKHDIHQFLQGADINPVIIEDQTYNVLSICNLAFIASGTATLEATCMYVPMLILYKLNWLTYLIAKALVNTQFIGLPNIIACKEVVPELVQHNATVDEIVKITTSWLQNRKLLIDIQNELKMVKQCLGNHGAIKRAAELVLNIAMGENHTEYYRKT